MSLDFNNILVEYSTTYENYSDFTEKHMELHKKVFESKRLVTEEEKVYILLGIISNKNRLGLTNSFLNNFFNLQLCRLSSRV
jgi:hypothetical protein